MTSKCKKCHCDLNAFEIEENVELCDDCYFEENYPNLPELDDELGFYDHLLDGLDEDNLGDSYDSN